MSVFGHTSIRFLSHIPFSICMDGNHNIPTTLLRHIKKHKAIEYSENISKGLLKKAAETFLLVTGRAHTKEICWGSYSHVKLVVACTALRLENEQCCYSGRD